METLHNGFTLDICPGAFPLSTDTMVLADFVHLPKNAAVLDLGSGCGTLGLLLAAKDPGCTVTGIELDEASHRTALENFRRNALGSRLCSICGDLNTIPTHFPAGSFSCCVANPPYFSGGQAHAALPRARREDCCTLPQLFAAAAWAVKFGGDFFLVHRPERLGEICACAAGHAFAVKQLRLVRHRADGAISLILLRCRKGAREGLTIDEAALHDSDNRPTDYFRRVYHQ